MSTSVLSSRSKLKVSKSQRREEELSEMSHTEKLLKSSCHPLRTSKRLTAASWRCQAKSSAGPVSTQTMPWPQSVDLRFHRLLLWLWRLASFRVVESGRSEWAAFAEAWWRRRQASEEEPGVLLSLPAMTVPQRRTRTCPRNGRKAT